MRQNISFPLIFITWGLIGCNGFGGIGIDGNQPGGIDSPDPVSTSQEDGGTSRADAGNVDSRTLIVSPQVQTVFQGDLAYYRAYLQSVELEQTDVTGETDWELTGDDVGEMKAPGVVYTDAAGTAQVVARINDQEVTVNLTVNEPEANVVSIQPNVDPFVVPKGFSIPVSVFATYDDGQVRQVSNVAQWESLSPEIVRVDIDDFGLPSLYGLESGNGSVRVTFGELSIDVDTIVEAAQLEEIEIIPVMAFVPAGSTNALEAVGRFSDGTYLNVTDGVNWSSEDEGAATVSNESGSRGVVSGIVEGDVEIVAVSDDGAASGTALVTVTPAEIISLDITPSFIDLAAGLSITVRASAVLTDSESIDVTQEAEWTIDHEEMAFFSGGNGFQPLRLETVFPGETIVRATYAGQSAEAIVNIADAILESISLDPETMTLPAGTARQFVATGVYSDGVLRNVNANADWTTTNSQVALVTDAPPGRLFAQSAGAATVTATVGSFESSAQVTVTDAEVVGIQVFPALVTAPAGDIVDFIAYAIYSDDTQRWVTGEVVWQSSDGTYATVSNAIGEKGRATTLEPGTVTISAELGEFTDSASLTVTDAEIEYVFAVPWYMQLHQGQKEFARMLVSYTNGGTLEVGDQATWVSADPTIAQVSNAAGTKGQVTAISEGVTTIFGNYQGEESEIYVEVSTAEIHDVLIWPPQTFLVPGLSANLYLVVSYEDNPEDYDNITPEAIWSTEPESIATVDNFPFGAGLVTAHAPGAFTLTAQYGDYIASEDYFVQDLTVDSLELAPASSILAKDGSQGFVALATFSNGNTQDVSASAMFSSADSSIATFVESFKGVLVGIEPGTVDVSAMFGGATGIATVVVMEEEPTAVVISPVNPFANLFQPIQLYATGIFEGGETGDMTSICTWSSSNPEVLMVFDEWFAKGRAHGLEVGTVTVEAQCGSVSDTTLVTVN